ncbi:kelch-like protein 40 [Plakobranchus ocellatus]|uniref:Kelch-like protein 40 n=1 Tax=Plakobranchus ocellatus TaxID=259542 RepID=A0AAV4CCY9_9GAST|nr:kelch-like protein 40 [Plakobranchus ocellatus]
MENTGTKPCADETITIDIVNNLAEYKDNSSFSDVTVVVGGTEFQCHRVILAAASPFFKAAFMCGMKEDREGKITLKSVDVDAFSSILTCMYCGQISLTKENLLSVWEAAHMLQSNFILRKAEEFFRSILKLDNCFECFFRVRLLSKDCHEYALDFIADNFDYLRRSESFNSLEKDELNYLISSERLEVAHEDDLIESLLKWAENDPGNSNKAGTFGQTTDQPQEGMLAENIHLKADEMNATGNVSEENGLQQNDHSDTTGSTRSQQLALLLERTRYFLTSKCFLVERLSCHPLVRSNARCVALVNTIARYHSKSYLHTQWCPPAAMHREKNKEVNVLFYLVFSQAFPVKKGLFVLRLCTNQCLDIKIPRDISAQVEGTSQTYYQDGKMYFFSRDGSLTMYWPEIDHWKNFGQNKLLEPPLCITGDWLYSFSTSPDGKAVVNRIKFYSLYSLPEAKLSSQQVGLLDLDRRLVLRITSIENTLVIFYRLQDEIFIIFFDPVHGTRDTIPEKLSLQNNDQFITLRKDKEVFILEQNGYFWRLRRCPRSEDFELTHESILWQQESPLPVCGAALVRDELFVLLTRKEGEPDIPVEASLPGVFIKVNFIQLPSLSCDYGVINTFLDAVHAVVPDVLFEREKKKQAKALEQEKQTYQVQKAQSVFGVLTNPSFGFGS